MAIPTLLPQQVHPRPNLATAIWFLHLRWVAVAGQLLTMLVVVFGLKVKLPYVELLVLIGITACTNLVFWWWLRSLHRGGRSAADWLPLPQVIPLLMVLDVLILTGMLYLTAGIANPFSMFYFVNVAVAGAVLGPAWAWSIWALTVVGVGMLLVRALPLDVLAAAGLHAAPPGATPEWTIPKLGFLVAFATCSGVILYFITALTGEVRRRERALQEAEEARLRNRQLESLATLAAGAAHELATPLSTIAVVASELGRALEGAAGTESARQDVRLIRSELDACRQILDRMMSAAGEAAGEQLSSVTLEDFLEETLVGLRGAERVRLDLDPASASSVAELPIQAAAQAVRNLLQNAVDASQNSEEVVLSGVADDHGWTITVQDHGPGIPADILERVGEPFFTTKEPGRGMGLGLYLTKNVLQRLGGSLQFDSQVGVGTIVVARIPSSPPPA
ncbi:MAG: ATPase [Pirellulaceae bacterium]|nr:MAG: ATPase [Pirellulaceae bacterium]